MKWLDPIWWKGLADLILVGLDEGTHLPNRLLQLNKDQNKIKVKQWLEGQSAEGLAEVLKQNPKVPVILLLASSQGMSKAILPEDASEAVSAVLGMKVEDEAAFAVELLPHSDGKLLATVLRKEAIEQALGHLQIAQERLVSFGCSPYLLGNLLPILEDGLNAALVIQEEGQSALKFDKGLAATDLSLRGHEKQISLDVLAQLLDLPKGALGLYALGYHVWTQSMVAEPVVPEPEKFVHTLKVAKTTRIATAMAVALGIWFASLSLLRLQAEQQKGRLEELYSQNLPVVNALAQLDERIAEKSALKEELSRSTLRASRSSFLLDRIASLCPISIRLERVVIGPSEEDMKQAGLEVEDEFDVLILGNCSESAPISAFSEQLSTAEWVQELSVQKSEMDFVEGQYAFQFALRSIFQQKQEDEDV